MEQEKYPICTCGKVSFPSQRTAAEIINFLKIVGKKKIPKRSYYSFECQAWHVTSEKTKKQQDDK